MATASQIPHQSQKERVPAIDIAAKYLRQFLTGYNRIYNGLGYIESSIDNTFSKYVKAPVNNLFGRQTSLEEEQQEDVQQNEDDLKSSSMSLNTNSSACSELVKPGKERTVGFWLLGIAALVYLMISLGAYTRLIKFGHSLTDAHPIGWKNQLSSLKKHISYYIWRKQSGYFHWVVLDEYFSTTIERAIGALFLVPLAYYIIRGFIMPKLRNRLFELIAMQTLQGFMSTWMLSLERNGRASIQDKGIVSTYRMFFHWNITMLMFTVLLWNSLTLLRNPKSSITQENIKENKSLKNKMKFVLGLNVLNFVAGVMVAGIDASRDFNTFPLMEGRIIPSGYLSFSPLWRDLFENPATVQFHHRLTAYATYIAVAVMWIISRRMNVTYEAKTCFKVLFALVNLQVIGGISALFTRGHWLVGLLHQSNAVWILGSSLFALHVLSKPNPTKSESDIQSAVLRRAKTD